MKIAIIGAGLSGIVAAKTLSARFSGHHGISVFEKSRGAGGRMSTRRTDEFEFDHGAQYFTARDPAFKAAVDHAIDQGHVKPWDGTTKYLKANGKLEDDSGGARYVSAPRMNSWIKAMSNGLNIQTQARVHELVSTENGWTLKLEDDTAHTGFDAVICAVPSPQAAVLLAPTGFDKIEDITTAKMDACFAVMLGFEDTLDLPWDTLRTPDGPASWIAVNSAKPDRPNTGTTLMVHAGPKWSNRNVERDKAELQAAIIAAASQLTGYDLTKAKYTTIHRWLYAAVSKGTGQACLADESEKLVVCGDWCLGGRVEGAWLSGKAAAEQVLKWANA
jgi:predicted NAD/FAD-dependent oxidoreductase